VVPVERAFGFDHGPAPFCGLIDPRWQLVRSPQSHINRLVVEDGPKTLWQEFRVIETCVLTSKPPGVVDEVPS
jgi:hypothetical protein